MQQPKTGYAKNGDVSIAYQVVGDGPLDLVLVPVRDLVVGSGIEFEERGSHELKGVPGSWDLLAVAADGADGDAPPESP